MKTFLLLSVIMTCLVCLVTTDTGIAQDSEVQQAASDETSEQPLGFAPPEGLTPLARDADVWIDVKRKLVVVDGRVALRAGPLEMFACPTGTKEHESIVAVNSKAQYVHAALLAIGAKSGHPVQFDPSYVPASGTTIEVMVLWKDADGKRHRARAQEWIKNTRSGKAMEADWVFSGSGFWTDPANGQRYYHGDGGDFICVSNFPTATLDLTSIGIFEPNFQLPKERYVRSHASNEPLYRLNQPFTITAVPRID